MSRGNVFKLSGNLALGSNNDTYSTNELQSIKSSLRLLKARQSQKKSQHNIDIGNNYGGSYSSNTGQRSDLNRNEMNRDINYYQSNAKNNLPSNAFSNNRDSYQQSNKVNSRNSLYQNDRNLPIRDRNNNYTSMNKNDYNNSYENNNGNYGMKGQNGNGNGKNDMSARNPVRSRTNQMKMYNNSNQDDYSYSNNNNNNKNMKNQEDTRPKAQTRPPLRKQQLNQQATDYTSSNNHSNPTEQKTIKQTNIQNKAQIVQYDPSLFVQCSVGCGRKFNPDSIAKHENVCQKVFQSKRKQFNTQDQRIIDGEHKKLVKNMQKEEKRGAVQTKKPASNKGKTGAKGGKNDEKMSKWKAQSLAFRAMLKQGNPQSLTAAQKQQLQQIKNVGMIKCPHCGRTFNQTAGPKHITFCQTQSKKNKLKK